MAGWRKGARRRLSSDPVFSRKPGLPPSPKVIFGRARASLGRNQGDSLMSIRQIRKSILAASAVAALAVAGLFAGRLSADAFPHGGQGDFAPRMFGRMARALDLTDDQKTQIRGILKAHASEITTQVAAGKAARQ